MVAHVRIHPAHISQPSLPAGDHKGPPFPTQLRNLMGFFQVDTYWAPARGAQ